MTIDIDYQALMLPGPNLSRQHRLAYHFSVAGYCESRCQTISDQCKFDRQMENFYFFVEQTFFDEPVKADFDCYGLAKTATVPVF